MKSFFIVLAVPGNYLAVGGLWFSVWLYRALLVTLIGGLVGFIISPILKILFFKNSSWLVIVKGGFITGCQYAGLWATAIALVWVIMDRRNIVTFVSTYLNRNDFSETE